MDRHSVLVEKLVWSGGSGDPESTTPRGTTSLAERGKSRPK